MKRVMTAIAVVASLASFLVLPAQAADDSKVKAATEQVETGAKKIGQGQIGDRAQGIAASRQRGAGHAESLGECGASPPEPLGECGASHPGPLGRRGMQSLRSRPYGVA